jgi:hypothetical protein
MDAEPKQTPRRAVVASAESHDHVVLAKLVLRFKPVWILCAIMAKLMPCGGAALSVDCGHRAGGSIRVVGVSEHTEFRIAAQAAGTSGMHGSHY